MTSAYQESSGPGDSNSIAPAAPAIFHWKGLLYGGGWRSKPKKRKQMPPEGASAGSQGPVGQWPSPLAYSSEQVPELLLLHCLPFGAAWLTLLPIVYSEGVIHKNSRTTVFFPSSLLPVLAPPSTFSSIKASELKALSAEGSQEARGLANKAGGRWQAWWEKNLLQLPGVPGRWLPTLCLCSLHPQLATGCRVLPPSLLSSYTVGHKL